MTIFPNINPIAPKDTSPANMEAPMATIMPKTAPSNPTTTPNKAAPKAIATAPTGINKIKAKGRIRRNSRILIL